MSIATRTRHLEGLFFRSCLESSTAHARGPERLLFSTRKSRERAHTQLHQLKRQMLRSALELTPDARLFMRLCGAANRAAELAWATAYPSLVFPCLFEELAEEIRRSSGNTANVLPWSDMANPVYD
jgi:hypothetical protein